MPQQATEVAASVEESAGKDDEDDEDEKLLEDFNFITVYGCKPQEGTPLHSKLTKKLLQRAIKYMDAQGGAIITNRFLSNL